MESSVYISSEQIQVIGYSGGTIKSFVTHPLPEGTMINGTITDQAFLIECLASMRAEHPELFKSPSLVADGSAILVKRIPAPKLARKQYQQLVRDDFAEAGENVEELTCGYQTLPGGSTLLACGASVHLVDSYISAFKSVGVNLKSIRIGTQAIMSYVASHPELKDRSFVLNVIDGVTMLSLIFENGANVFISRTRLYGDTKEQLAQTIIDNLGGLIQFNRSQKFGEVTDSYYLGVSAADLRLLDAMNPHVNVKLASLNIFQGARGGEQLPPNAHFAFLNMRLGAKDIDLIASRRELNAHRKKSKKSTKRWIPFAVLFVIALALPVVYLYYQVSLVDKDIETVNEYLQDPANIAKLDELNAIDAETKRLNRIVDLHESKLSYEGEQKNLSNDIVNLILSGYGPDITIRTFVYSSGQGSVVRINGNGATEYDPADYSDFLKASPLIRGLNIIGYGKDYSFTWDVLLTPSKELADE